MPHFTKKIEDFWVAWEDERRATGSTEEEALTNLHQTQFMRAVEFFKQLKIPYEILSDERLRTMNPATAYAIETTSIDGIKVWWLFNYEGRIIR
jgi:hypothetical protein